MLQAQLAAKNTDKLLAGSSSATKSKSKRKISEDKECESETPVAKKEQAKPKVTKGGNNKLDFLWSWEDIKLLLHICYYCQCFAIRCLFFLATVVKFCNCCEFSFLNISTLCLSSDYSCLDFLLHKML